MIISAITIENFKSIKEPVRIELKPITLLFGSNSVGKSTIIQALHYTRAVIKHRDFNADRTETGGDSIRLGGFHNLVHNHDLKKAIRLKFELNLPDYLNYDLFEDTETTIEDILSEFPEEVGRIKEYFELKIKEGEVPWVKISIRQDSIEGEPYVAEQSIGFGDEEFILLTAEPDNIAIRLSIDHPLFPVIDGSSLAALFLSETGEEEQDDKGKTLSATHFLQKLPSERIRLNVDGTHLKRLYEKDLWDAYNKFESILNVAWQSIVDALKIDLDDFRYIGPLRVTPDADFIPNLKYDPSRWANGVAAWDSLVQGDWDIEIVNLWLSDQFFKTGYTINREQLKEIDTEGDLYKKIIEGPGTREDLAEQLQQLPVKVRVSIQKENTGIIHHATDIGVGISQLVPIIPLALGGGWDHEGVIAIEQPELHIHPAMQVVLGDLFIEGLDYEVNMPGRKRFLLETHSEHLLLRLLRRIRGPRKDSLVKLRPDDLGIYFLESSAAGVKATHLRVDQDGEFQDEWPVGFFEEREEELL